MVYNSVKLSEPQISFKKNMQHHAECKEPTGIKLLKADTPLHTLKLIDWWLKKRLVGQLREVN